MLRFLHALLSAFIFLTGTASARDQCNQLPPPIISTPNNPPLDHPRFWSLNGRLLIIDEVDDELLVFSDPSLTELESSFQIPNGFGILETVRVLPNSVELVSQNGSVFAIPDMSSFNGEPPAGGQQTPMEFYGARLDTGQIVFGMRSPDDTLNDVIATISPVIPTAEIVDWRQIAVNAEGTIVHWNELSGTGLIGVVSRLADGRVVASALIDWSAYEFIPENPVVVDSEGHVFVIAKKGTSWSHGLDLKPVDPQRGALDSGSFEFGPFFQGEEIPEGKSSPNFETSEPDDDFSRALGAYELLDEAMLQYQGVDSVSLILQGPVKRSHVISRALQYQSVPWFYRIRNHAYQGSGWKRPNRLDGKVGTWLNGFPYKWGGYQSVKSFLQGVVAGKTAGDVETNTVLSSNKVVGCDCSGCLSAWWGMRRLATIHIPDASETRRITVSEMRPGDVFNKAGSHVRMLLNQDRFRPRPA